jgi:acetyl esterase/lipase
MGLIRTTGILLVLELLALFFPARSVGEDALLRYRLMRAREAALMQQNEEVLMALISASRKLAEDWHDITNQEKREYASKFETALGLSKPEALPDGLKPEQISYAVPRREFLDVEFCQLDGPEAKYLSYDVYSPLQDTQHPIVVWVHGGGFVSGDKQHPLLAVMKPDFFLSRGFVFASVNYRLAPQYRFPAQGHDMAAALAHLYDHAEDFGGNPGQIFLIGDSAGAQLVSIVSTNESFLRCHKKPLNIIRGTVTLDIGSFDVPSIMDALGDKVPKQYHDLFTKDRGDWIAASPMLHVSKGKSIPPMLMIYVAGREHHERENHRFANKLKRQGCDAEVFEARDRTHHTLAYNIGVTGDPSTEKIMEFIRSHRKVLE